MTLDAATAWDPLPGEEWTPEHARHLLRRAGWTARPAEVAQAVEEGLMPTLQRWFPEAPPLLEKPPGMVRFESLLPPLVEKSRHSTGEEKRTALRELRERSQAALQDARVQWLQAAAAPGRAVFAKWVFFLGDVYVVGAEKVQNASFVWRHGEILAANALGGAPALTKAVSRSPAMIRYLDLYQSKRDAPNENFARELFELFVLGEGHYTERDIKEAARAFTGYRFNAVTGDFHWVARQHDAGRKTVFGQAGAFDGDQVIDLAYAQPAAAEFLPRELARFYLGGAALPAERIRALADRWRAAEYNLRELALTFFGSRQFFAPEYRGGFIKSPVQFQLGLVQDLELRVSPLPRFTLNPLRQMGQLLFQPPNVRGWVGGRAWINSSTLAARRQLVQRLFDPPREETLTADEQQALADARVADPTPFSVTEAWIDAWRRPTGRETALALAGRLLPVAPPESLIDTLAAYLDQGGARTQERLRTAAATLLQTPEYQLC